jgi:hypothetical protein
MSDLINTFKAKLSNSFSNNDAFSDTEGTSTYEGITTKLPEGKEEVDEKWSQKYKNSIDCKNPKGFSQKAHCQGKKKKSENKEATSSAGAGQFSAPLFGSVKKEETKESTSSASSGSYITPASWAKSMKKKDWRGKSKTQIPGGKFVTVKEKCKKFPYCNQGDIKALKIYENEMVKNTIKKISNEYNINENVIKAVIQYELEKNKNNTLH